MELHFTGVASPIALAAKLNGCLLFKRTRGVATARDNDVWCTFEAAVTKQKLMQACAMMFRHWGARMQPWLTRSIRSLTPARRQHRQQLPAQQLPAQLLPAQRLPAQRRPVQKPRR